MRLLFSDLFHAWKKAYRIQLGCPIIFPNFLTKIHSSGCPDTLSPAQLFGKLMVHVVNGDQLQSLLTVIKYLTKDIEDKEETFEVLRSKMLKLLSKPWLENDSAALDESIKSLLQFTDDELSELSYGD